MKNSVNKEKLIKLNKEFKKVERRFIIFCLSLGVLSALALIIVCVGPDLINVGRISAQQWWLSWVPLCLAISAVGVSGHDYFQAKQKQYDNEYDAISKNIEKENILEQFRSKLKDMTIEEKKRLLDKLDTFDEVNKLSAFKDDIRQLLINDINMNNGKSKIMTQTISPIERLYDNEKNICHSDRCMRKLK